MDERKRQIAIYAVKNMAEEWDELHPKFQLPQAEFLTFILCYGSKVVYDALCVSYAASRVGTIETQREMIAFVRGFISGRRN